MKAISPFVLAILAVVLWLCSSFIPHSLVLIALFFAATAIAKPLLTFEGSTGGTFTWTFRDWIGLAVLIVVVYALVKGVDPIKLLDAIGSVLKAGGK